MIPSHSYKNITTFPTHLLLFSVLVIETHDAQMKIKIPSLLLRSLLILAITVMMNSCTEDNQLEIVAVFNTSLLNCWTHSYEEENNTEEKIYRLCDFREFGPSRYRSTYIFKEDNSCQYLVLAPNDAHYFQTGRWEWIEATQIIVIKGINNEIIQEVEVIEMEEDRLKVRYAR